jgi:transcriptional regulator with XRE-family HTH domain
MTTKRYGTKELEKEIGGLTFGKLLESQRKCEEMSQKDFAALLGISASSLCDLEKGRKIPSASRAMEIATTLGVSEGLWVEVALQDQFYEQGIDLKVSVV